MEIAFLQTGKVILYIEMGFLRPGNGIIILNMCYLRINHAKKGNSTSIHPKIIQKNLHLLIINFYVSSDFDSNHQNDRHG
jgi:hypothetical protein